MSDTIYLPILLAARRTIKRLAAQEDVPPGLKTARDALSRVLPLLDDLDFRPIKSEADCLMDTVAANVDNEKLSDADFREFIRNSIRT